MSLDATRWAWQQKVTPMQKLVLLSLADRADEYHRCFPSTARLISDTGCHRTTVFESIQALEELGVLVVQRVIGKGNIFTLIGVTNRHATSAKNSTSAENHTSDENSTSAENRTGNDEVSSSNKNETSAENSTGSKSETSAKNHTGEENCTSSDQSDAENQRTTSADNNTGLVSKTGAENHTGAENSTSHNEFSASNEYETSTEKHTTTCVDNHTGDDKSSAKNHTGTESHTSAENRTDQYGKPHYHQCGKPHSESTIESINKLPACQSAENDKKLAAVLKSENAGSGDSIQNKTQKQNHAADLCWPKCIDSSQREGVLKKLNLIADVEVRQAVLDELAGAAKKAEGIRQIKYPIKLLTIFIEEVLQGEFIPQTGVEIRKTRERLAADDLQSQLNREQAKIKAESKVKNIDARPRNSFQEALAKAKLNQENEVSYVN